MFQKSLLALAVAGTVALVGCGGSGGSDGGGSSTSGPAARNNVAGPLDAVQDPVSSQVLAPLAAAADGTPLEGVVRCVDQIVVGDALDIADVLAAQADGSGLNPTTAAPAVQRELTNLIADLQGLLTSLSGASGACGSIIPAPGSFTNPLGGTPLASFGASLASTLTSVQNQLTGAGGSPSFATLSGLIEQLATGYQTALAMAPAEATSAPVLGPSLGLIGTVLDDLTTTVAAAETSNAGATSTALAATVDDLLSGLLLDVVPIVTLETEAGQPGALSTPIADAIDQLVSVIAGGFGNLDGAGLPSEISSVLSLLTDPGTGTDPTGLLDGLLTQLTAALTPGGTGGSVPDIGPDALNQAVAQITTLLESAGTTGTPLDDLVTEVVTLIDDLLGGIL